MATSRISRNTKRSSSMNDRQQVQVRIRALQQRTNALYEELAHSSSITQSAMIDIENTYQNIITEVEDQRDQLLQRLELVKKEIKHSTNELNQARRNLNTAQSLRIPSNPSKTSTDADVNNMTTMTDEIEHVLHQISQKLKQYRFIPSRGHPVVRPFGTIQMKNIHLQQEGDVSSRTVPIPSPTRSTNVISLQKLYSIDLDIHALWIVASIDKRIFLCDNEGELRIFSYSRQFHRQPLLTERFHVSSKRLITSFTVTHDYLVTYELDTQMLALHTHHGALIIRLEFAYEPLMIIRGDLDKKKKNSLWTCSAHKKKCYQLGLNHRTKQINILDQIDFTLPITNLYVDPIGISCDENNRVGIHDVSIPASDHLLLFSENQNRIIPLDMLRYDERLLSSRIERVLLVPRHAHLILLVYSAQYFNGNATEILLLNIKSASMKILCRLFEANGVENLDCTMNGEFIYTTRGSPTKRVLPKMHIYRFTDE